MQGAKNLALRFVAYKNRVSGCIAGLPAMMPSGTPTFTQPVAIEEAVMQAEILRMTVPERHRQPLAAALVLCSLSKPVHVKLLLTCLTCCTITCM